MYLAVVHGATEPATVWAQLEREGKTGIGKGPTKEDTCETHARLALYVVRLEGDLGHKSGALGVAINCWPNGSASRRKLPPRYATG